MELLGLFGVAILLYLLIAPVVALLRSGRARDLAQEAEEQLRVQGVLVRDLQKQLSSLRVELRSALAQRGAEAAPKTAEDSNLGRAVEPETIAPASFEPPKPAYNFDPDQLAPLLDSIAVPPVPTVPAPSAVPTPPAPPRSIDPEITLVPMEAPAVAIPTVFDPPAEPARAAAPAAPTAPVRPPVRPPAPPQWSNEPLPPVEPSALQLKIERLISSAREWLFGGNLVAKIGLLILFIGVAFLLRLAASYIEIPVIPIEVRLAAVAAGAIGLLWWGWRIRISRPGIALPVQGAALAILMLVSFGAFKLFKLIPAGPTFALLLILVAFTCILAVLQNALWLAIFGIVGGFAVPILLSTGGGSHIALFTYYALLNGGVLAIALRRDWRLLNVLGFLFTFVIGSAWGIRSYQPEHYSSSQGFLILFLLFYVAIAVIYAWRRAPQLKSYVDGTLVFGVPTVAMGLQYGLVKDVHLGMAFSALGLGLFYAAVASVLWRLRKDSLRLLVESFFALAVVFGTLAIPLAFNGRWTSAAWALEGAGIIWVGLRQKQAMVWRFGILVQVGSWLAFLKSLLGLDPVAALANNIGLGFLVLGVSGVFLALSFRSHSQRESEAGEQRFAGLASSFIGIAVVWLLAGMWVEVWLRVHGAARATLFVLTAIGLVVGLQLLGRRTRWSVPNALGGAVAAVAGISFLGMMARYMVWHNVETYSEQSFTELLGNGSFFGGLLLSAGSLVTSFAFKRRVTELEAAVADSASARLASVWWFGLAMFWWCGFALHGLAHALAWLTTPLAGQPGSWVRIGFWSAFAIGLALSAWGWTRLALSAAFAHRSRMLLVVWPALSALGAWLFYLQNASELANSRVLDFDWRATDSIWTVSQVWLQLLAGPLSGALILVAMAWLGLRRTAAAGSELSEHQRSRGIGIWVLGLGWCWFALVIDVLAQAFAQLQSRWGWTDPGLAGSWLGYADLQLLLAGLTAVAALLLAQRRQLLALRWLAAPAAVLQALASLLVLGDLYDRAVLPTVGTGIGVAGLWLALHWSLAYWHKQDWPISPFGLRILHFARVIAPWMMIAPLVSLNLSPWLATAAAGESADTVRATAGMWPDYLGAWAALAVLFVLLRQVRRAGWPLRPLQDWYGAIVLPLAALWALLLAVYWNLRQDGNMAPLPYLPILNPLDLTCGFVALLLADLWRLHRDNLSDQLRTLLLRSAMALGFAWFNLMLLRSAATWLGLPYQFDPLYNSQIVQAMLSLVWTLSAFLLMRFAARRWSRSLWMIGAGLLAVVVLKLFMVDLRKVGSVAQVVSFMGVGGLMLLIGYLAPLPREQDDAKP